MDSKKVSVGLLVLSVIGFASGLILKSSTELGLCLESEPTCINQLTQIGNGLFYGMGALAIVFLILTLVPQAFSAWKKFAIWAVPLLAIYFAIYENTGFFSIPEETVYRCLSIAYVVVSLAIILFASRKNPA